MDRRFNAWFLQSCLAARLSQQQATVTLFAETALGARWFLDLSVAGNTVTGSPTIRPVVINAVAKIETKGWTEAEMTIALVDFVKEYWHGVTNPADAPHTLIPAF